MKSKNDVRERLEKVKAIMDGRGLPHGLMSGAGGKRALRGVQIRETVFPRGHRHGGILLEELHRYEGRIFRYLGGHESYETFRPEKTVFVDTETTGLAGGAGTYVFLVGTGFFDERGFVVRQFLMPELSEEREMLSLVAEELHPFRSVITFNGMAFDMPLLHTRCIMQGMRPSWSWEHHLDLLPLSRRLWRGRFESCRLACLEERVLDFRREGDVPGHAIPALYVRFLREKRLSLLEPVLTHNALDIASLPALAVSACRLLERGEELALDEGWDFDAAGRVFAADSPELSLECFREALACDLPEHRREWISLAVGRALKSSRRWAEAVAVWEQLRREYPENHSCRTELAKYYEHKVKDIDAALEAAREALTIVRRQSESGRFLRPPLGRQNESEKRVRRLEEKKLRRGRGRAGGGGRE